MYFHLFFKIQSDSVGRYNHKSWYIHICNINTGISDYNTPLRLTIFSSIGVMPNIAFLLHNKRGCKTILFGTGNVWMETITDVLVLLIEEHTFCNWVLSYIWN